MALAKAPQKSNSEASMSESEDEGADGYKRGE